ncbi:MAG TPA: hypothetical protein IGS52_24075 [Oscillatoriaceae cyanobacterium M33_DOE_052]|uniref:Uncharacterized protein n=1 Tax=Planktothricoides sp. SpSt-374 TaxID=2282167 RepID=A0A7C3ZUD5_9CYAN|nr:hypothetical protein [Oscillatoriaceae cyanobacterium M33_DOE_052]
MNYYKFGLMTLVPLMLMYEWFRRVGADSLTAMPPESKPSASNTKDKDKDSEVQLPPVATTTPDPSSARLNQDITAWGEQVEQQARRIALLEEQLARATVAAGEAVAAKAALSLQLEQQALRIVQLEQELAAMQGVAAIGDSMLNKWRYRHFSR